MLSWPTRWGAYRKALSAVIPDGGTVIEIGTGAGVMALEACRLGAARVIALEPNEVVEIARLMISRSDFADRIMLLPEMSTSATPPCQGDVMVSDLRGSLPLFEAHLPSIIDARTRWLKPGGIQIPAVDRIHACLVESGRIYGEFDGPWRTILPGVNLEPARRITINTFGKASIHRHEMLSQEALWQTLDYRRVQKLDLMGDVTLEACRPGFAHGVALWFDTDLHENIGFSNAPGNPDSIYGQTFFPFQEPWQVRAGDVIEVRLDARMVAGNYVWRWESLLRPKGPSEIERRFRQSSFQGLIWSARSVRKRGHSFVPKLNEEGLVYRLALNRMAEGFSLEAVSRDLATSFPRRFRDVDEALAFVGTLSQTYSE